MLEEKKINVNGRDNNYVIYIPDNISDKLPATIFEPGKGEQSTNVAGCYLWGPMGFIKAGWKPNRIMICIQPNEPNSATPSWTNAMLKELVKRYPQIDTSKLIFTGLSLGTWGWLSYVATPGMDFKPAAMVLFSFAWTTPNAEFKDIPMWGLCGDLDQDHYGWMATTWNRMSGWPNKPFTVMNGDGHGDWNKYYDPNWLDAVMKINVYDWPMQFISAPVITPTRRVKSIITVYDNGDIETKNV
jgi:hypothetical protein